MSVILRVFLNALAFFVLLPMIDGIQFHGNFVQAIAIGAFFVLMSWVVEKAAAWLTLLLAVGTLGLALLFLIPFWIFGFALLPAITLKVVASVMPQFLAVSGWLPAILGGLVLFVISCLTGGVRVTVKSGGDK